MTKKQQLRGCGKQFDLDRMIYTCGNYCNKCKKIHLCPSCQKKQEEK
mgnify:CR=1 FL=1